MAHFLDGNLVLDETESINIGSTEISIDTFISISEVDTISGTLQSQIDTNAINITQLESNLTTVSGITNSNAALISTTSGSLQTQIDGKDNYQSWSFAIDGVTKDSITSLDVLDFVSGPNITITRSADDKITISGSEGTTDHSLLNNLDYTIAGHTGFQPAGDYATNTDLATVSGIVDDNTILIGTTSGTLQSQIDTNTSDIAINTWDISVISGTVDTNTADIAQLELDLTTVSGMVDDNTTLISTTSGTLQNAINAKPDTLLELTDTPSSYDNGKFLKSTADGTEWATVSGTGAAGVGEVGKLALGNGVTTGTVSFISIFDDTTYSINTSLENTTDAITSIYDIIVTDTTTSGFSFELTGATDSANYILNWSAIYSIGLGTSNHALLSNLDYASSGHTGFAASTDLSTFGSSALASGVMNHTISLGYIESDANYIPVATIQNAVDETPSVYAFIITTTTVSGFNVILSGELDSSNYTLNWNVGR